MTPDRAAFYAELLAVAHAAAPPHDLLGKDAGDCAEYTFDGPRGWKVTVFYDCGELDYLVNMKAPDGVTIDVWAADIPAIDRMRGEVDGATPLQHWRGCHTTQRILDALGTWGAP